LRADAEDIKTDLLGLVGKRRWRFRGKRALKVGDGNHSWIEPGHWKAPRRAVARGISVSDSLVAMPTGEYRLAASSPLFPRAMPSAAAGEHYEIPARSDTACRQHMFL